MLVGQTSERCKIRTGQTKTVLKERPTYNLTSTPLLKEYLAPRYRFLANPSLKFKHLVEVIKYHSSTRWGPSFVAAESARMKLAHFAIRGNSLISPSVNRGTRHEHTSPGSASSTSPTFAVTNSATIALTWLSKPARTTWTENVVTSLDKTKLARTNPGVLAQLPLHLVLYSGVFWLTDLPDHVRKRSPI